MDKSEIGSLCLQLQRTSTGANAHTALKAAFYLNKLEKARIQGKIKEESFIKFVELVRGAVYRGEWKILKSRMTEWW